MRLNINTKKKKLFLGIILLSFLTLITITIIFYIKNKPIEAIDESWGLGRVVTEAISNDRDYEWYVDQRKTGFYGDINCGPAVIEMVDRWKNKYCTLTSEYIRDNILKNESGTPDSVLYSVFKDYAIEYKTIRKDANASFTKSANEVVVERVKKEIKSGKIVLISLDTKFLTWNTKMTQRTGKYYDWDSGHWIIVKGYKVVDKKLYFQVYDPYGSGWKYDDGTLWAKDRYYLASEVIAGCFSLISISK